MYSEYKAGNTVNQIKMAVTTVLISDSSKPRVQYQIWKTGLVTLALHRTGNPKWENLTNTIVA